jgi:hypothetical protein
MNREPLITSASVVAFAGAVLSALVSFGLDITNDQQSKLLAVIGFVAVYAVAFLARPKVTPVSDPRSPAGEFLTPVSTTTLLPGAEPTVEDS